MSNGTTRCGTSI